MTNFEQTDIEPLDFIINECLNQSFAVTTDNLIKSGHIKLINEKGYGTLPHKFEAKKEFVRYLYILNEEEVCECSFAEDAEFARKNSKTLHFQKQGGFKKLYSDRIAQSELANRKSNLEIKNLELQKENFEYQKSIRKLENQIRNLNRDNLRLGNWDIRFRWYIAVAGFIIGIITKYFIDN